MSKFFVFWHRRKKYEKRKSAWQGFLTGTMSSWRLYYVQNSDGIGPETLVFQRMSCAGWKFKVDCHFLDGKEFQVALSTGSGDYAAIWVGAGCHFDQPGHRMKVNPFKTELFWLNSSRRNPTFLRKESVLFGSLITPVNVVRNLGVILDENMTMSEHIARGVSKLLLSTLSDS